MAAPAPTSAFATLPVGVKVFILFAGLAVLSAGYYLGIHMGLEDQTKAARNQQTAQEQKLKQAHDRRKEYLKLREELAARENLDKQYLRVLPEAAEIPAFLDDLNRLAELSGLSMTSVSPQPEKSEKFFIKVPVGLAISGRYHQLAKFFYNISRLERAINMEDIQLGVKSVAPTGEVTLTVSVSATTFRRNPAEKK